MALTGLRFKNPIQAGRVESSEVEKLQYSDKSSEKYIVSGIVDTINVCKSAQNDSKVIVVLILAFLRQLLSMEHWS